MQQHQIGNVYNLCYSKNKVYISYIFFFFLKYFLHSQKGKLHFTTLNYTPCYTYHPKLCGCTLTTLNYYLLHTLHPPLTYLLTLMEFRLMCKSCESCNQQKTKLPLINQYLINLYGPHRYSSSSSHSSLSVSRFAPLVQVSCFHQLQR